VSYSFKSKFNATSKYLSKNKQFIKVNKLKSFFVWLVYVVLRQTNCIYTKPFQNVYLKMYFQNVYTFS